MDVSYFIDFVNFEEQAIQLAIDTLDQPALPVDEVINPFLTGSESPVILESVEVDDDKTKVIKGKRLTCGFLSTDPVPFVGGVTRANNVDTFSDGDEANFRVQLNVNSGPGSIPFLGSLVLDDNTEAFQPTPNPVRLYASEGLGSLKDVPLRESDDDVPVGHFRIIDYLYLCLNRIRQADNIYVAMNLYEKSRFRKLSANFNVTATNKFRIPYDQLGFLEVGDTIEITGSTLGNNGSYTITNIVENPTTSIDIEVSTSTFVLETTEVWVFRSNNHTFWDIMLDALTFENGVNERDDCATVINKILDAFGCFIVFDDAGSNQGWYIIRWDEYDRITTGSTTLKFAKFVYGAFPTFDQYMDIDLDRIIAHDSDLQYTGHRLSNDSAVKRFQRRWKSIAHIYNFQQPLEVPCNVNLLRGTVDDDVIPLKTYIPDCWTLHNEFGSLETTPTSELRIWVRYDDNGNETERYLVLTPTSTGDTKNYAKSQGIEIIEKDKFEFSVDYSADTDNSEDGPATTFIGLIALYGDDGSVWVLGDNGSPEWKLSNDDISVNRDMYAWVFGASSGSEDYTEFRTYSIESPPAPVDGKVYIHLFAANQVNPIDDFAIRYNNIQFTYIPFINGGYRTINGQQSKVTGDNNSRKNIEHEMFIGESDKKILKGALKKFDGVNYVLTETWNYYHDPTVLTDSKLAKHIVYQWWNQYRKTRTVIETDIQGLGTSSTIPPPSMIHRWEILHGDQDDKKFMLTSFRNMDFRTCGWTGVFVETSDADGDRNYDDDFEFKYIQS